MNLKKTIIDDTPKKQSENTFNKALYMSRHVYQRNEIAVDNHSRDILHRNIELDQQISW